MSVCEKALVGGRRYWAWIGALLAVILVGVLFYLRQLHVGLGIPGLSRAVTRTPRRPLHPVGSQHPHRHGIPLQRPPGAAPLADRPPGPPLPRVRLRLGPGAADPAGHDRPPAGGAPPPAGGHPEALGDRQLPD